MKKLIIVSVVRFNQSHDEGFFLLSDTTTTESLKAALVSHVESLKDSIINFSEACYEDGDTDGYEGMREATYKDILTDIKAATTINDYYYLGRYELDDGVDEDTEESVMSHITIWSGEAKPL